MDSNPARQRSHPWLYPLIAANLAVVVTVVFYLVQAYRSAEEESRVRVSNLVTLVRFELEALVGGIDTALRAVAEEPVAGPESEARRLKLIERIAQEDAQFRMLAVVDAAGQFVGGKLPADGKPFNVVGRDYYDYLKNNSEARMLVSGPYVGRVNGKWSLVFSRRLNHADGRFAGLVLTGYALERFAEPIKRLDLAAFNAVSVLKSDRTVLLVYPENPKFPVGMKTLLPEFSVALDANPEKGFVARLGDGSAGNPLRMAAYQRSTDQRFYVATSARLDQVFAGVYRQTVALSLATVLIVVLSLYFGRRTWRAEARLHEYRHHLEAMVEARTQALTIAKNAAEEANRAKQIFLANMSHELRTPMNIIMGFTEIVKRHLADAKDKEHLDTVLGSARKLLELLKNLMELARIESEQLELNLVEFDAAALLQGLADVVAPEAAAKGLAFRTAAAPEFARLRLRGDTLLIGQILLGLAENAVKFTPTGEVAVELALKEERDDHARLQFDVRDTGIGISAADQKRLFAAFEQLDGSPTRQFGGTGIGLALCKRLAERMGGTVAVTSEPGVGSVFSLRLQLAKG